MNVRVSALPEGWGISAIETLLAPLEDGRILHQGWSPQCEKDRSPSDDEWGVLKTTAIQPGAFCPEHNKLLPAGLTPRPHLEVRVGDLLITCAGPRARCGVACLVKSSRPRLMISGKMYRFRALTDRIEPRYLEAFLQTQEAQASIEKMKTGTSDSGLNLTHDRFRRLMVPLAPREDQDRIVEEIEKQLTRLDAGVAALKRVQTTLARYRAAVLKVACEGRLVPTEAELARREGGPYEPAATLLTRILVQRERVWQQQRRQGRSIPPRKYRQPRVPDVTGLRELPEGWAWASAEQLTDETRAITYGVIKLGGPVDGGVPVLRSSDVRKLRLSLDSVKRISPAIADRYRRTCLQGGEVLVTVRGTLGGVATVPCECTGFNISREVAMLALVEPEMAGALAVLIASQPVEDWLLHRTRGIAYTGINIETLKALPVPVPPLAEQHRIVAEVERRLSLADDLEHVVSASLHRATRLRQAILSAAFSGRLTGRDEEWVKTLMPRSADGPDTGKHGGQCGAALRNR